MESNFPIKKIKQDTWLHQIEKIGPEEKESESILSKFALLTKRLVDENLSDTLSGLYVPFVFNEVLQPLCQKLFYCKYFRDKHIYKLAIQIIKNISQIFFKYLHISAQYPNFLKIFPTLCQPQEQFFKNYSHMLQSSPQITHTDFSFDCLFYRIKNIISPKQSNCLNHFILDLAQEIEKSGNFNKLIQLSEKLKNDKLTNCIGEGVFRIREYISLDTLQKLYSCLQVSGQKMCQETIKILNHKKMLGGVLKKDDWSKKETETLKEKIGEIILVKSKEYSLDSLNQIVKIQTICRNFTKGEEKVKQIIEILTEIIIKGAQKLMENKFQHLEEFSLFMKSYLAILSTISNKANELLNLALKCILVLFCKQQIFTLFISELALTIQETSKEQCFGFISQIMKEPYQFRQIFYDCKKMLSLLEILFISGNFDTIRVNQASVATNLFEFINLGNGNMSTYKLKNYRVREIEKLNKIDTIISMLFSCQNNEARKHIIQYYHSLIINSVAIEKFNLEINEYVFCLKALQEKEDYHRVNILLNIFESLLLLSEKGAKSKGDTLGQSKHAFPIKVRLAGNVKYLTEIEVNTNWSLNYFKFKWGYQCRSQKQKLLVKIDGVQTDQVMGAKFLWELGVAEDSVIELQGCDKNRVSAVNVRNLFIDGKINRQVIEFLKKVYKKYSIIHAMTARRVRRYFRKFFPDFSRRKARKFVYERGGCYLSLTQFIQYYEEQIQQNPQEVIRQFKCLGVEGYYHLDPQQPPQILRKLFSQNFQFQTLLYNLLEVEECHETAYLLKCRLNIFKDDLLKLKTEEEISRELRSGLFSKRVYLMNLVEVLFLSSNSTSVQVKDEFQKVNGYGIFLSILKQISLKDNFTVSSVLHEIQIISKLFQALWVKIYPIKLQFIKKFNTEAPISEIYLIKNRQSLYQTSESHQKILQNAIPIFVEIIRKLIHVIPHNKTIKMYHESLIKSILSNINMHLFVHPNQQIYQQLVEQFLKCQSQFNSQKLKYFLHCQTTLNCQEVILKYLNYLFQLIKNAEVADGNPIYEMIFESILTNQTLDFCTVPNFQCFTLIIMKALAFNLKDNVGRKSAKIICKLPIQAVFKSQKNGAEFQQLLEIALIFKNFVESQKIKLLKNIKLEQKRFNIIKYLLHIVTQCSLEQLPSYKILISNSLQNLFHDFLMFDSQALIQKLCFHDLGFSLKIAHLLLIQIAKEDKNRLLNIRAFLGYFLSIQDTHQAKRIKWILGVQILEPYLISNIKKNTIEELDFRYVKYASTLFQRNCLLQQTYSMRYTSPDYAVAAIQIICGLIRCHKTILKYLIGLGNPCIEFESVFSMWANFIGCCSSLPIQKKAVNEKENQKYQQILESILVNQNESLPKYITIFTKESSREWEQNNLKLKLSCIQIRSGDIKQKLQAKVSDEDLLDESLSQKICDFTIISISNETPHTKFFKREDMNSYELIKLCPKQSYFFVSKNKNGEFEEIEVSAQLKEMSIKSQRETRLV